MWIKDDIVLQDIQRIFHQMFPGLKIEFFSERHEAGEGSSMKNRLDTALAIGAVRTKHTDGDLQIDGAMTVRTLETRFLDLYGLNVQVFRRSGNLWIQTTATDSWTLDEQNHKGGSSEQLFNEKYNPI